MAEERSVSPREDDAEIFWSEGSYPRLDAVDALTLQECFKFAAEFAKDAYAAGQRAEAQEMLRRVNLDEGLSLDEKTRFSAAIRALPCPPETKEKR